jgi:hypothetical protein
MPAKYFLCPNGNKILIEQCLQKCPRPIPTPEQWELLIQGKLNWADFGRCLALGHLTFISYSSHTWHGKASVTQLIKPTRQAWLEIVKEYTLIPDDQAFTMYGTLHHQRLETVNKKLEGQAELKVIGEISGIIDRLEPDELKEGFYKLIDYKLVGAYSIAKALGNENRDPDMNDWELQLNKYKLLLEADSILSKLFPISRLVIQATVRDSGLKQINMLNLPKRMPMIPVKLLDPNEVNEYFMTKDYLLYKALEDNIMPPMCEDTWQGRRCRSYCSLAQYCPEGAKIKKLEYIP